MSTKKILVVDDSLLLLEVTREALETEGFTVLSAENVEQLEKQAGDPDLKLILMDVQMPELYGDDVAMVLRTARGIKVPIYLYSNLSEEELKERAADAGVDGYICKRNGIDAAVARIKEVVG